MKTTLDLPDDLVRAVKIRAVEENKKLRFRMVTTDAAFAQFRGLDLLVLGLQAA